MTTGLQKMHEEYYIRTADSETARGPYNIDKLVTLAEAGQVNRETLYYDEAMESWVLIAANDKLKAHVFPEKKKLKLKKDEDEPAQVKEVIAEEAEEKRDGIEIDDLLAAAEGETEDTKHLKELQKWQHRSASISVPFIAGMLILSAIGFLLPHFELLREVVLQRSEYLNLLTQPLIFLGLVDLIMGFAILLRATEIFPLIRFRVMFGAGFFAFLYWSNWVNGQPDGLYLALSTVAMCAGIFVCTITLNFKAMILSGFIGLAGSIAFMWYSTYSIISELIPGK